MAKSKNKILFLAPYPNDEAPSQRFRFEQYYQLLEANGYQITFQSFYDEATWKILYKEGKAVTKSIGILKGYLRRIKAVFKAAGQDVVFIHREVTPLGPPIFEWLIARVLKKKCIYDFDDAIWLPNTSATNSIAARLKWHRKVGSICKWSFKVAVGNDFLSDYAKTYNEEVVIVPTTIDTTNKHTPKSHQPNNKLTIGWTGTHSTLKYLNSITAVIETLCRTYNARFIVISNTAPDFDFEGFEWIKWNKTTEIQDLKTFDIGVMPLTDDMWSKGKCGFKALQYLALGVPALVSPVAINKEIVVDGVNGFHCSNNEEWYERIEELIVDRPLRLEMGRKGIETVVQHYSVKSNTNNFLSLFE